MLPVYMTDDIYTPVIVFDPGASTGFAALGEDGSILVTMTLSIQELPGFMDFIAFIGDDVDVVVEQGPEYGHHSPITRRAEGIILDIFPSANRVPPGHWKTHPHYRRRVHIPRRLVTAHEHDAVRLGQWFQETRRDTNAESGHSTRQDSTGTRHKRK